MGRFNKFCSYFFLIKLETYKILNICYENTTYFFNNSVSLKINLFNTLFKEKKDLNKLHLKFFLLNQIIFNKNLVTLYLYIYIFKYLNVSNYILSDSFFFTIFYNVRLNYKLNKTINYKFIYYFNNKTDKLSIFLNFLYGFKTL